MTRVSLVTLLLNIVTSFIYRDLHPSDLRHKIKEPFRDSVIPSLSILPLMILRANIANNLETMYKYLHIFIKSSRFYHFLY